MKWQTEERKEKAPYENEMKIKVKSTISGVFLRFKNYCIAFKKEFLNCRIRKVGKKKKKKKKSLTFIMEVLKNEHNFLNWRFKSVLWKGTPCTGLVQRESYFQQWQNKWPRPTFSLKTTGTAGEIVYLFESIKSKHAWRIAGLKSRKGNMSLAFDILKSILKFQFWK